MLLFHDIDEFPKPQNGCVVTIGKFDGVHLGHQLIFDQLKSPGSGIRFGFLGDCHRASPRRIFTKSTAIKNF